MSVLQQSWRFGLEVREPTLGCRGQGFEIVVSESQLIGPKSVGPIDAIDPSLRFQNGLSVVSVVIQQGLQVGFEVIGVSLGTDERVVEWNADLFEEEVGFVIDQKRVFGSHCIRRTRFLQFPFDLEGTAREIHVIIFRIDMKIDRVDPRGEGMDGDHAVTHHAEIGRGNLEQIQDGIAYPRRPGQRHDVRHRRRLLFLARALRTHS